LGTCAGLLGLAEGVAFALDETIVFGLLVACPLVMIGWIYMQFGRADAGGELRNIYTIHMGQSGNLAILLACSGFMGRAAGILVPSDGLAHALNLYSMPDWVLLSGLPIALCAFSAFGFSPIMMAIFFGSLFGGMTELPADVTLIALAISCGWGLSMTSSPFATVILMINRLGNVPMLHLTMKWNLTFNILSVVGLIGIFYYLAR